MKNRIPWLKTNIVFSAIFIVLVAIDRLTKQWAVDHLMSGDISIWDGVLRFHYLENRGAAWGLFSNAFWLFYIITAVAVLIMAFFYAKIPFQKRYWFLRFSLVMLCAGAVGNFIDRAWIHYVIDFIYFELIDFPVFNVADIFVTVSVLLLVFGMLFKYTGDDMLWKSNRKNNNNNTKEP